LNLTVANDGIFWMLDSEILDGFAGLQISPFYNEWNFSWHAVENDIAGISQRFNFTIDESTPMIVRVDLYPTRMYARGCKTASTTAGLKILLNGKTVSTTMFWDYWEGGWIDLRKSNLSAGSY
jgi:hypothetical protein